MKPIGGFLELETGFAGSPFHEKAASLTSGRACLNWILTNISASTIHVPFYTCDALLQPITEKQLEYRFYAIDRQFRPLTNFSRSPGEYVIYINYFGLNSHVVTQLANELGKQLIVDNTQAFFETDSAAGWSFNSARKVWGVPDGAYLYGPVHPTDDLPRNTDVGCEHLLLRLQGQLSEARAAFLEHESKIDSRLRKMSPVSEKLLSSVDYARVRQRRQSNFRVYEEQLHSLNKLPLAMSDGAVPFCYPLLLPRPIAKSRLYALQIFIPTLWQDVIDRAVEGFNFERQLSQELLALPVDHRYDATDCYSVCQLIRRLVYDR